MTIDEVSKAMESQTAVYYNGGEYYISGVISRFGRQPYMTGNVPEDKWWYQVELTDLHSAATCLIYAALKDISKEKTS